MNNWQALVPDNDKEHYPQLYGAYLNNLPENIKIKYIYGSNPGYYDLGESSRVCLENALGERVVLVLSRDNMAFIDCPSTMNDDSRRAWKKIEEQLPKNVEIERKKLFNIASSFILNKEGNKSTPSIQHALAQDPWLAFTLRNLQNVYVDSLNQQSKNTVNVTLEANTYSVFFDCWFDKKSGFKLLGTRFTKGIFHNGKRTCKNAFIKNAQEVVKRAAVFQKISDWHNLSIRERHLVAKDDWLVSLGEMFKEHHLTIEDLWGPLGHRDLAGHFMEIALATSHKDYKKSLKDKEGSRALIVCNNSHYHGIVIKPQLNGSRTVKRAIHSSLHHYLK